MKARRRIHVVAIGVRMTSVRRTSRQPHATAALALLLALLGGSCGGGGGKPNQPDVGKPSPDAGSQSDFRSPSPDIGGQPEVGTPSADVGSQPEVGTPSADAGSQPEVKVQSPDVGGQLDAGSEASRSDAIKQADSSDAPQPSGDARSAEDVLRQSDTTGASQDGAKPIEADAANTQPFDGGMVTANWLRLDSGLRVYRQTDGKLLVVGLGGMPANQPLFARFLATGAPDPSFGKGGFSGPYISTTYGDALAVACGLAPDGKVMCAITSGRLLVHLVRIDSSGALDASFGTNGVVVHKMSSSTLQPLDLLVQPDGKVVVVGDTDIKRRIARFQADGSLDTTFANTSEEPPYRPRLVAIDSKGRLLVAGAANDYKSASLVRYLPTGELDTSFGQNGLATAGTAVPTGYVGGLVVQPDGRILLATSEISSGSQTNQVVRFTDQGALDTNFGSAGVVSAPGWFSGLAVQGDGKIVAGRTLPSVSTGVFRMNVDGTVDTTFGKDGQADVPFNFVCGVTTASDGSIFATGYAFAAAPDSPSGMADRLGAAKVSSQGVLDTGFGENGIAGHHGISGADATARAMALQPDGKIVVAAGNVAGTAQLLRFHANGLVDSAFGGKESGRAVIPGNPTGVVVDRSGRLLVSDDNRKLARLDSTGAIDPTFKYSGDVLSLVRSIAFAGDGSIVLAGSKNLQAALSLVKADGATAKAAVFSLPKDSSECRAVTVLPSGAILAAGSASDPSSADFVLLRTSADLMPDSAFANNGIASAHVTAAKFEKARAMAVQSDGKILLAGYAANAQIDIDSSLASDLTSKALVMRFSAEGVLDSSFGASGVFADVLGGERADAFAVTVDAAGRILVAGLRVRAGLEEGIVIRLLPDGKLDSSFGTGGIYTAPWPDAASLLTLAIEPSGSILAAGRGWRVASFDLALVRIMP